MFFSWTLADFFFSLYKQTNLKDMRSICFFLLLLLFPGLKAQDVKFDITLKGTTLNYTVANDTPNDIFGAIW